jgi:hypothetical protein
MDETTLDQNTDERIILKWFLNEGVEGNCVD